MNLTKGLEHPLMHMQLHGLINEKNLQPLLEILINTGFPGLAMELLRLPLNRIGVEEIYKQANLIKRK